MSAPRITRGRWLAVAILAMAMVSSCTGTRQSVATNRDNQIIAVNAHLWRASLDVLQFMPLASADPYGGIILTDWYVNAGKPDERFKASVYILDSRLRADAVSVKVFRETMTDSGWQTASVSDGTAFAIEGAILEKARRIYLSRGL